MPEEYNDESQNKFMNHIMTDYAIEERDEAGNPLGNFRMDRKQTESVARE